MKRSISPRTALVVIIMVVVVAGWLLVRAARGPGRVTWVQGVGFVDPSGRVVEPEARRPARRPEPQPQGEQPGVPRQQPAARSGP